MITQLQDVYNNHSLYGDRLTQMPSSFWEFTTQKKLTLYVEPLCTEDWGLTRVDETYYPSGKVRKKYTHMHFPSLFFKWGELGVRRLGGALLTSFAWAILMPIGMLVKSIHLLALSRLRAENSATANV